MIAADDRGALNLALKDQLTAFEWVQTNIGAFGGDKTKVRLYYKEHMSDLKIFLPGYRGWAKWWSNYDRYTVF